MTMSALFSTKPYPERCETLALERRRFVATSKGSELAARGHLRVVPSWMHRKAKPTIVVEFAHI